MPYDYERISSLERLIESRLASLEKQIDDGFRRNQKQYEELAATLDALNHTVRGSNGNRGIVTDLAVLQQEFEHHLQDCDEVMEDRGDKSAAPGDAKNNVTWDWIRDKAAVPIFISAFLFFVLEIMPKIFVLLGGTP